MEPFPIGKCFTLLQHSVDNNALVRPEVLVIVPTGMEILVDGSVGRLVIPCRGRIDGSVGRLVIPCRGRIIFTVRQGAGARRSGGRERCHSIDRARGSSDEQRARWLVGLGRILLRTVLVGGQQSSHCYDDVSGGASSHCYDDVSGNASSHCYDDVSGDASSHSCVDAPVSTTGACQEPPPNTAPVEQPHAPPRGGG